MIFICVPMKICFRLIELGKLQLKTDNKDKREYALNSAIRKVKNKSGVVESRPFTCPECSEEFCDGRSCCDFNYDLYTRIIPTPPVKKLPAPTNSGGGKNGLAGGKKKIKSGKGDKKKVKKRTRSRSPGKKKRSE